MFYRGTVPDGELWVLSISVGNGVVLNDVKPIPGEERSS